MKKQTRVFIAAHPYEPDLNFLELQIIGIEEQLYLKKSTGCGIEEAIAQWERFAKN